MCLVICCTGTPWMEWSLTQPPVCIHSIWAAKNSLWAAGHVIATWLHDFLVEWLTCLLSKATCVRWNGDAYSTIPSSSMHCLLCAVYTYGVIELVGAIGVMASHSITVGLERLLLLAVVTCGLLVLLRWPPMVDHCILSVPASHFWPAVVCLAPGHMVWSCHG